MIGDSWEADIVGGAFKRVGSGVLRSDYDQFYTIYHRVNDHLWDLYREGAIAKPKLTVQRFEESFEKYGYPVPGRGAEINEAYLSGMPAQTRLVEGARELLDYLAGRYRMAIITNGSIVTGKQIGRAHV